MAMTPEEVAKDKAKIKELYIDKNMSPADVATELGISTSAVYRKISKYKLEKSYAAKLAAYRKRNGL